MRALRITSASGMVLDVVEEGSGRGGAGSVVTVHGLASDLDGGGLYTALAGELRLRGLTVVRFSMRDRDGSGPDPLAGQIADVQAVARWARAEHPGPLSIVAASLGAVAVLLSLDVLAPDGLVLWNPVLDPHGSILARTAALMTPSLRADLEQTRPDRAFLAGTVPVLLQLAGRDDHVSPVAARELAAKREACELRLYENADHAFRPRVAEVLGDTADWLASRH